MVYHSRSSRGCGNCRTRRIKCDRAEPTCSQCLRARFSCPGYRDPSQLQYRNESHSVQSRVQSLKCGTERHKGSIKTAPMHSHQDVKAHVVAQSLQTLPQCLSSSSTGQSICFFFRYYVLDDGPDMPIHLNVSQMEVLAATSPSVKTSLSAVGLAALSNINKSARLMAEATGAYTHALRLTNCALKDECQQRSDSTLAASMLLAMFEVLTCSTTGSLESWRQHIRGAATLIEMRGAEQIREIVGMRMFTHLRVQIISSCLHSCTSVPSSIVHWSFQAMSERSPADAKADELVDLVARVSQLLSQTSTEAASILASRAASLDNCLLKWKQSLPPRWAYRIICGPLPRNRNTSNINSSYPGVYHLYPDLWACNIWNFYRSARIRLNQLSIDCIETSESVRPRETPKILELLATEIAASVPYALGFVEKERDKTCSTDHYLGGFVLLWPLYLATNVSALGSTLREWGIDRLEDIGHRMGIGQAQFMARRLRNMSPNERLGLMRNH